MAVGNLSPLNDETYLKMLQAQQAWDLLVWKNMCACPWLFYPVNSPIEGEKHGFPVDLL